jgi:hypothetical protein
VIDSKEGFDLELCSFALATALAPFRLTCFCIVPELEMRAILLDASASALRIETIPDAFWASFVKLSDHKHSNIS